MSAVILSAVWLNDYADPSDAMSFTTLGDTLGVTSAADVDAVAMAGGGVALVTREGTTWSANPHLMRCSTAQTAWLRAHEGRKVWFRDYTGVKFCGYYAQVSAAQSTFFLDKGDIELTISSVSGSEAV